MKKLLPLGLVLWGVATQSRLVAAPQKVLVPLFDVEAGYLLGGSQNRKWIGAKATATGLKSGATYRVFSATRGLGTGKATKPQSQGAPCPDTLWSKISPDFSKRNAQFALGGAHNPLPRTFANEKPDNFVYRALVASILKSKGIVKPDVQLSQVWRVDLDGDGTQEVLITATRKADYGDPNRIESHSRAGDYSLLLLRRLVKGKVRNELVEGEFYPRAKEFNAPGFYRLAAVLDTDGDGKMEFLVRGAYYEGHWTSLYVPGGLKTRAVLTEGCGA